MQICCTNLAGEELVKHSLPADGVIIDLVVFARKELGMVAAHILIENGLKVARHEHLESYTKLVIKEMKIRNIG